MGLIRRTIRVLKAKFNRVLTSAEDPTEQLELAYQRLEDQRREVKSSVVDINAQQKRLEKKRDSLRADVEKHNRQAEEAMKQDREDLARTALSKKKQKMQAADELDEQIGEMSSVEDELRARLSDVEERLSELRTQKEVLKARHQGAEAMESVEESMAEGMGEYSVEDTVADIEEEIAQMQSRAEAIGEIEEENKSIDEELEDITIDSQVEDEMETLRERHSDEKVAEAA